MAKYIFLMLIMALKVSVSYESDRCSIDLVSNCWRNDLRSCKGLDLSILCPNSMVCDAQTDTYPCFKCETIFLLCGDVRSQKAELSTSLRNCKVNSKPLTYSIELTAKNYPIIRNGAFARENIAYLDLSNNKIELVEGTAFDFILGLKDLNLNGNHLVNVSFGNKTKRIEIVSISANRLKFVNRDSFWSLFDLRFLNLESNRIEFIHGQAFSLNRQLRTVFLLNNKIKDIQFKSSSLICLNFEVNLLEKLVNRTFNGFSSLQFLSLSGNFINIIEKDAFFGISRGIQKLNLDDNKLESIEVEYFQNENLRSLKSLDLSENKIEFVNKESFKLLTNLNILNLKSNKIKHLKSNNFDNLSSLTSLDLSNLMLVQLNASEIFSGMIKLKSLLLNSNSLEMLANQTFLGLNELEFLNLESNLIESIEVNAFKGLFKLANLYMKLNLVSTLRDYTFDDLTSVIVLDLGENRINRIEKNAFAGISKSLNYLYMSKNKLQFIKITHFKDLANLLRLDLSDNQISSIQMGSFDGIVNLVWLNLAKNSIFKIEARVFLNQVKLKI